ncbi:hypothetical protein [Paludisphaera mucosa]|uniref:Uncharacterized protein n=1 Tax=Paludisphaera mucosa TaxID=3030827 RepID=A0ABT6F4G0_9BACT|nr:hypothetical protein [Paludisphaera mucosa]MDG3002466.1 hypothetical protein [Paludisphaera mucosa]
MLHALVLLLPLAVAADPIDVGGRKQLFIDDRFLAERERVELHANPPQKLGLLRDEKGVPFMGHVGRVIEDGGKVRLYLGHEDSEVLESDDGLQFRRTGARLPGGLFPTIFVDPHEADPARRYKLFHVEFSPPFDPAKHGVFASYSADGLNFTRVGQVLPLFTDNPPLVHWDERIGKYLIYTRALAYDSENQRRIGRIETDDVLKPWPHRKGRADRMFSSTDNLDVVYMADEEDDPHSDVYYNSTAIYPEAQDVYLMFPTHFRHFSPERNPFIRPPTPGRWEDFGMLEVQLAVSRDGVKWERPGRDPYVPGGLADEWDRWYAVMGPGVARRGNYLYQYYNASGRLHDSAFLRAEYEKTAKQLGGVGVVRQRLDGFVSADADHRGGRLRTPAVVFRGDRLRLNIDAGAMGTAFVELQDAEGRPIPGFTLADCEEIGGNFLDQAVYWKGNPDVSSLAGRPVRIHVKMKRAKLYSFQFTQG